MLGIVSRAPNKYTDLDPEDNDNNISEDSDESVCSSPNPEEIAQKREAVLMQSSASRLTTDGRKSKKLQDDEVSHNNEENSGFSTTNGSGIISLKSKGAKNLAPLMNK